MPRAPPLPALLTGLAHRVTSPAAARQLHAQLLLRGLPLPARAAVTLIAASSCPRYACAVFHSVPAASANVYLWTATISSYAKHASPALAAEAFALFRLMLRSGPPPNAFTLTSLLKSLSPLRAVHEVRQAHAFLLKSALGSSVHVGAALLDSYGTLGQAHDARTMFDEIPTKNVVVGNSMVSCYVRGGQLEAAREVFDGMAERDAISWNTLMSGYLRRGDADAARALFDEMPRRNVNSWNMMIAACSGAGLWGDSVGAFNRMRLVGFQPDAATMAVLMSACAQLGFMSVAKQVHGLLRKGCVEMNCHVRNSLVDMIAKCGCIGEARSLFAETRPKDVVSYNVMVCALAQHGHGKDALKLFNKMTAEEGMQPDAVTFLGVLSACAHAGLVDDGEHYFQSMGTTYAIQKSADHYACMVDLYGRAGLIEEAHRFVKVMPVKPHAGVWGALLNACRKHCNVDVGDIAARELVRIEPLNPGNYILHANTLARSQRWDAVEDVRRLMRGNINEKNTGFSWVEVDTVVHEFLAGDFSHPSFDQIYNILDHLYLQLT
ncbi:pentatricopeptide repeat-containing protein At5g66520-like [Lolium perenne]|uniref:pentatricopeptide repeat-containing protein At5g66520-like n=1 Tax=Lolium perenne TaxID=4522 RepID=UPI0021F59E92|nr:pentatricopeptide repeat-containing protein At3g29230-like [Lolium perenne]